MQELENLAISELPPLRLGFLVSRRYEEKQPQDLLRELPRLQMRFQNRANFEAMLDAYMRPCGINPTIIYRPYSFMAKISAVERGQFLTVIPHFAAAGEPVDAEIFRRARQSHVYAGVSLFAEKSSLYRHHAPAYC